MPAPSRLRAAITLLPLTRDKERLQLVVPLAVCQVPPLSCTCTTATPVLGLPESLAVPTTTIPGVATERALGDVIVTVGSTTGGRAKIAAAIHKRVHGWREKPIPLHNVAAPKVEKKAKARTATKKVERD